MIFCVCSWYCLWWIITHSPLFLTWRNSSSFYLECVSIFYSLKYFEFSLSLYDLYIKYNECKLWKLVRISNFKYFHLIYYYVNLMTFTLIEWIQFITENDKPLGNDFNGSIEILFERSVVRQGVLVASVNFELVQCEFTLMMEYVVFGGCR